MDNNNILRRIRYIFDYGDSKIVRLFAKGDLKVTRAQMSNWLKKEDDPDYQECKDKEFAMFLNGLINDNRGKREGAQPEPESFLSNNIVFTKLKIALNLKAEDVLAIFQLADFAITKSELSSFFRKKGHRNYSDCKDQVLRNFLKGLQMKYRVEEEGQG